LQVLDTIFDEPYLSVEPDHQGLLLHSVYHWPNGWDYVPAGASTPRGESSQWGDYHAREAALYVKRLAEGKPYLAFFGPPPIRVGADLGLPGGGASSAPTSR
jgi:unsaturated chondroitin disaccharide hydrolase